HRRARARSRRPCDSHRISLTETGDGRRNQKGQEDSRMIRSTIKTGLLALTAFALTTTFVAAQGHTSSKFSGAKVNAGTVTHSVKDGKNVLTLSGDFQVPDTPDPHWQIVDSKGNTYLLQRLGV